MNTSILNVFEFETTEIPLGLFMDNQTGRPQKPVNINKFCTVRLVGDTVKLQVNGYVGLLPVNSRLTLNILPRVQLANLARLLEVSGHLAEGLPDVLRTYRQRGRLISSVVSVYTDGLRRFVDEIDHNGLMKDYVRDESLSSQPQGRFLVDRTMQLHAVGTGHQLWSSAFRRTADIPANQCILFAIHALSRANHRMTRSVNMAEVRRIDHVLNYCAARLSAVSLVAPSEFLNDPLVSGTTQIPSLRSYYRGGLSLAKAVIEGTGIDLLDTTGNLLLQSMLINMSDVFERYVRQIIARQSVIKAWGISVLDGNFRPPTGVAKGLFDSGAFVRATPDIVVRAADQSHQVVIEVKYVPATRNPERSHIDQTLAYGLTYRAPHLVIVQPLGSEPVPKGIRKIGTIQDHVVWQYVFDLNATDTSAEEEAFSSAIQQLAVHRTSQD